MVPISYRCTRVRLYRHNKIILDQKNIVPKVEQSSAVLKGVCALSLRVQISVSLCTFSLALTLVSSFISVQSIHCILLSQTRNVCRYGSLCVFFFFLFVFPVTVAPFLVLFSASRKGTAHVQLCSVSTPKM